MEFDSSMMQPKVVLEHCDIAEYDKQDTIDYKPKAKRKIKKSVTGNCRNPLNFLIFPSFKYLSCAF